jgi:Uncharacterized conserved protein (DUF2190)
MPAPKDQGVPVNVIQSLTMQYLSATPAVAGQMVDYTGNLVTAAGTVPIYGVLRDDAVQNRYVSVAVAGLVEVLSGGAIAAGSAVASDATGKGVTAAVGQHSIGRVVPGSAATAANQKIQVLITREGTN